jgi:hypothetical protein
MGEGLVIVIDWPDCGMHMTRAPLPARIDSAAKAQDGKRFAALKPARQAALLHAIDAGQAPFNAEDREFFRQLKSYTAFAYYTAEVGATRELAYAPVPGGFKGDVPLKKVGRGWALY